MFALTVAPESHPCSYDPLFRRRTPTKHPAQLRSCAAVLAVLAGRWVNRGCRSRYSPTQGAVVALICSGDCGLHAAMGVT